MSSRKKYFTYRSLDDLRADAERLGIDLSFDEKIDALGHVVRVGNRTVGNAFAIHPMEGCDGTLDGKPDELTVRRWQRFASGGAKLIWGEATAVVQEGRANPRQLLINDANLPSFAALVENTRSVHRATFGSDDDLLLGLQLTHSGRYSYQQPIIAYHHPQVDAVTKCVGCTLPHDYPLISDDELERLEDAYVSAARLAMQAGFDFIDIKQCHSYLLNELLGARTRKGRYGGKFENRTRFVGNVLDKIRAELGDGILLASRINVYDGIPFARDEASGVGVPCAFDVPYHYSFGLNSDNPLAFDLSEPMKLVSMLRDHGVSLINVTMGSPYYNPHIGRPFERTPEGSYLQPEHPLAGVKRHFDATAAIQKSFPDLPIIGTGYSWLQSYLVNAGAANVRSGNASFVGVGRGALAYPEFARDALEHGKLESKRVCLTVSFCTDLMRSKHNELGQYPVGCIPRDRYYAEVYRETIQRHEQVG